MDFRLTEEQLALQETLRRFIAKDYDFERRRSLARSPLGYSAEAWAQYAELGLLACPSRGIRRARRQQCGHHGGHGTARSGTAAGALREYGRALRWTASRCRARAIKEALLPQIAAGKLQLALAAYEAAGRYELAHVASTAVRQRQRRRLTGRKSVVLDAPSADYFLLSARSSGYRTDAEGISLFLVRHDAPGLTLQAYPTQSGGRAADLHSQMYLSTTTPLSGTRASASRYRARRRPGYRRTLRRSGGYRDRTQ